MPAPTPKVGPKGKAAVGLAAALAIATPFVAAWEGKSNDPYKDIVGVTTVCYGETRVKMRRYTDAECKAMLREGLADYAGPVLQRNPNLADRPQILAAATSLSYNIGNAAYARSTVAKRFSAGDYKGGCDAFLSWRFAGGKEVRGLLNRRNAERKLCLEGV